MQCYLGVIYEKIDRRRCSFELLPALVRHVDLDYVGGTGDVPHGWSEIGVGVLVRLWHVSHEHHDAGEQSHGDAEYQDVGDDLRDTFLVLAKLAT